MRNSSIAQLAAAIGATILERSDSNKINGVEFKLLAIDEAHIIESLSSLDKWNKVAREFPITFLEPESEKLPDYHHKDLKRKVLGKKKSRWS